MSSIIDYNFLESFINEQKSIFEKEKAVAADIVSMFVQELRSGIIQIGSVCAFLVSILFGVITLTWISESIGQILITVCIITSAILIFGSEYLRNKFLANRIQIILAYDNALWTMSELKRNITINIVLNTKMDFKDWYFFIFCAVCSERVKMLTTFEDLLKNPIFKMKARDYSQFYTGYEDIIKKGKIILKNYSNRFASIEHFKNILATIEPLEKYELKSQTQN